MSSQYLIHLPDGTEYGPVDRATLEAWSREGRLPAEALVWPEGAPAWMALEEALAAPASASAHPGSEPRPAAAGPTPPPPAGPKDDSTRPLAVPRERRGGGEIGRAHV